MIPAYEDARKAANLAEASLKEFRAIVDRLTTDKPEVGAMLLDCSDEASKIVVRLRKLHELFRKATLAAESKK